MKEVTLVFILLFSVSCQKKKLKESLFTEVDSEVTKINFKNSISESSQLNIVNYIYFYNGGGVASGDINNDNLPDLFFTVNQGPNKLYINQGNFQFKDISKSAQIEGNSSWNSGVTMVDINNDSYLDIYVSAVSNILNFKGKNELFINNGDNTFTERSEEYGLNIEGFCTQSYFFDYDNDDDLDVYIVRHATHTSASHGPSNIRIKRKELVGDLLLKNDQGKFVDVSQEAGIYGGANSYGLSASIGDFDNNGFEDIYVCNDFHEDDYYYLNQGNGKFIESLQLNFTYTSRFSMGSDAADLNNDNQLDIITLDMLPNDEDIIKVSDGDVSYEVEQQLQNLGYQYQYSRNMLQMNSNGNFYEVGQNKGVSATDWSWGPLIADYDNDGQQDLFISNGIPKRPNNLDFMNYISNQFRSKSKHDKSNRWLVKSLTAMPEGKVPNKYFKGDGVSFIDKTSEWSSNMPTISNGSTYADLDNDGDLDLVTNNINAKPTILKNNLKKPSNYLKVKLKYNDNNHFGVGSKVTLFSNGQIKSRQLLLSRGFISSVEPILHFGLGDIKTIDSLIVQWPNKHYERFYIDSINQSVALNFGKGVSAVQKIQLAKHPLLTKVDENNNLRFLHKEDDYLDWNINKLSSYKISAQGPALAISNNELIFIGNGAKSPAELHIWKHNSFHNVKSPALLKDAAYEDTAAVFFDFDLDGDDDLYVVSGESSQPKIFKKDRLYINNGNNVFKKREDAVPNETSFNGSVVKVNDFDKDGYDDVFVGAKTNSSFASKSASLLLKNNKGTGFSVSQIFDDIDFVSDAVWFDVDNDGWKDLIIASEWNYIKAYKNVAGSLVAEQNWFPEETKGLWQHLNLFDIDGDNDLDLIVGNWGENSKLQRYIDNGISLWINDFDNNGTIDPIICFKENDKYIPIQSKQILSSQLTVLNKKYNSNKEFVGIGMKDMFSENIIRKTVPKEINNLANGYFINEGGKFSNFIAFENKMQLSSINSSTTLTNKNIGHPYLLTVGNILDTSPNIGQINSINGFVIFPKNKKNDTYQRTPNFFSLSKKSNKKIDVLYTERDTLILVATNNDSLQVMKYSEVYKQ